MLEYSIMSDLDKLIFQEYSSQSGNGSMPYFVGKQYGGGWLRNIARFAFPFVKKALGFVGNIASNTAEDVINNEGTNVGQALKKHAVAETKRVWKRRKVPINRSVAANKRRKLIIK